MTTPTSKLPPLASMTTAVCSSIATATACNAADKANIATIGNAGIITRFATSTPSPISALLTWRTFLC
jgi:hypothetical protein